MEGRKEEISSIFNKAKGKEVKVGKDLMILRMGRLR